MKRCLAILLLGFGIVAVLLVLIDREPVGPARTLDAVLADTADASLIFPDMESNEAREVINRFQSLWANLSEDAVRLKLNQVYAENIWFNDTLKTIENLDDFTSYMLQTVNAVDACRVEFLDVVNSGPDHYVRWRMTVVPKGAMEKDAWRSTGITLLRFNSDGRVIVHQDYWDAAGGFYENLPVIGRILRNIRARI
ncbi:MAG TPA: nuclear transport factor 2 family protein [Kiritimatiellia bacterium]|nr:nuclear transport factor 2 family protein [Kiritimatiellia bacterium]